MILLATSLGLYNHGLNFDSFLSEIFKEDKKDFKFILCDGLLPACQMSKLNRTESWLLASKGQEFVCERCILKGSKTLGIYGHNNILKYSDFVPHKKSKEVEYSLKAFSNNELINLVHKGAKVGEHGYASALRFFGRGDLYNEKHSNAILRKYVAGAIVSYDVFDKIFSSNLYTKVIAHHGIYTPQGLIVAAANKHSVDVITWVKSYKKDTFILSHNDSYHHTMISEKKSDWSSFEINQTKKLQIMEYIQSRRSGENDSISFNRSPKIVNNPKLKNFDYLLLTSVLWDAQVHYKANLFQGILDWIIQTIEFWIENKKSETLCIRIHPAEVNGFIKSRQRVEDEIRKKFKNLPSNIIIVSADDQVSSYDLIDNAKTILVYSTKTAIEASALGKNVIVCGDAWVRGKGFTIDPKNEKEYFKILKNNKYYKKLSDDKIKLAQIYAYHFFFRRMLVVNCFKEDKVSSITLDKNLLDKPSLELSNVMEVIRNGIYNKKSFIYQNELINEKKDIKFYQLSFLKNISRSVVLEDKSEIELATEMLEKINIKCHHDSTKNWDTLKMLSILCNELKPNNRILDAGCGKHAVIANRLADLDFQNIFCCDILDVNINRSQKKQGRIARLTKTLSSFNFTNGDNKVKKIQFSRQDVCNTKYKDKFFDGITSLSVIEHLNDPEKHIYEMSRILVPGGIFLLTTDYWPIKIDCTGIFPYGKREPEMKIFSADDISNLIKIAKKQNLILDYNIELSATDKVCRWDRVDKDYTFLFLKFQKKD